MKVHHRDGSALSPASDANGTAPPFAPTATTRTAPSEPARNDNDNDNLTPRRSSDDRSRRPRPVGGNPARTAGSRSSSAGPTRSSGRDPATLVEGLDALVADARGGEDAAMTELVRRFTPLVRAVVRRAGVYGAEAEDVEQETWLRLAVNIDRVREPTALPRWLSVTAGRLCSSLFDKRRRVLPSGDFSDDAWLSPERWADPADFVCLQDEVVRLYGAIDTLGARDRQLVVLLMDAVPYREISARIAMPVGSIGPTRERVLRKLAVTPELRPAGGPALVPAA